MLAKDTAMFLLIPDASNKRILHPGTVVESCPQSFVTEFTEPIAPEVGMNVVAYGAVKGKFFQQGAAVAAIRGTEPLPVIAFTRVGDPVSAENRQIFRVSVATAGVIARIEDEKNCPVVDLSAEGFGAVASGRYKLGSVAQIAINYEGQLLCTLARVQTVKERPDKKYRYGFLILDKKSAARKSLEQISAMIQRQQLQRLAGAA